MSSDQEKDLTGFPITGVAPSDPGPELDAPVSPTGSDDPDLEGAAGSGPGDPSYRLGGPLEAADLDTVPEGADEVSPSKPARAPLLGRVFGRRRRADEGGADTTEVVRLEKEPTPSEAKLGEVADLVGDPSPSDDPEPRKAGRFARFFGRKGRGEGAGEEPGVEISLSPGVVDPAPEDGAPGPADEDASDPSADGPAPTPARKRFAKKRGMKPKRGFPPIQVLIGWIGESSRRDVLAHARGFAEDHIEAIDTAWIATAEFRGGTLFEIHEGGDGQAYLPDLIEELSRDPEQVLWVPSGTKLNRVVTFSLSEGRPFSMMLNETDSARVRESGQAPIERSGKMRRLSPRGTPVLVVGATLFAIGFGSLAASAYLAAGIDQQPLPALSYNAEVLPHGQIVSLSSALRDDRWVSRIVFENGAWRAEFETFDELVLPEGTEEAQRLIEEAVERDAVLQRERDRKIEELRSE